MQRAKPLRPTVASCVWCGNTKYNEQGLENPRCNKCGNTMVTLV